MKVLLDTHTFLWFINDSPQLSSTAVNLLGLNVDALLSVSSLWEIAIKANIGKLTLPDAFETFIPQQLSLNDIAVLPTEIKHLGRLSRLPLYHRDPFDRFIIAQALSENIAVISIDEAFDAYKVNRIW